jgi:hypothetical protein
VDTGKKQTTKSKELLPLPDSLKSVPYQVVDVFLCRVQPIDYDQEWTERVNKSLISDYQMGNMEFALFIVKLDGETAYIERRVGWHHCAEVRSNCCCSFLYFIGSLVLEAPYGWILSS